MLDVVKAEKVALRGQAVPTLEAIGSNFAALRTGDAAGENARAVIEALRLATAHYEAEGERRARNAIAAEGTRHTRNWTASVKAGTQIDIAKLLADEDLVDLLSVKSEEFVSLIRKLSADTIARIERETLTSIFGKSNAQVAKALQEIEGIARNRARLIARDQASKLNAAMNEFRQGQAGVEKFKWKTIIDGRERASHHARNNKIYSWDAPPSGERPGQPINCFPAGTMVQADALAVTRHWYAGQIVTVETAAGNKLTGTPNHPVLSSAGWKGLGEIHEGDCVLGRTIEQAGVIATPDVNDADVPIEQVFDALARHGVRERVPLLHVNFHGDRPTHDVDIVWAKGELVDVVNARRSQSRHHPILADADLAQGDLLRSRPLRQLLICALHAAHRIVGSAGEFLAVGLRCLAHPQQHALAAVSLGDAGILEASNHGAAENAKLGRDSLHRLVDFVERQNSGSDAVPFVALLEGQGVGSASEAASRLNASLNVEPGDLEAVHQLAHRSAGSIQIDRVVKVYVSDFAGHVFNIHASQGLYLAHGIVVHNCRCRALAVLEEYED